MAKSITKKIFEQRTILYRKTTILDLSSLYTTNLDIDWTEMSTLLKTLGNRTISECTGEIYFDSNGLDGATALKLLQACYHSFQRISFDQNSIDDRGLKVIAEGLRSAELKREWGAAATFSDVKYTNFNNNLIGEEILEIRDLMINNYLDYANSLDFKRNYIPLTCIRTITEEAELAYQNIHNNGKNFHRSVLTEIRGMSGTQLTLASREEFCQDVYEAFERTENFEPWLVGMMHEYTMPFISLAGVETSAAAAGHD